MDCFRPYARSYDAGKSGVFKTQLLPCGRCGACRVNRAIEWSNRLLFEADYHTDVSFWTLTYASENEPQNHSISKRELQLFFKRLRKFLDVPIKYFACGEYGETYGRPHYHAIIFGLKWTEEEVVLKCWNLGHVKSGTFNRSRARYVAGYMLKEVDSAIDLRGRTPPFLLMSKGLGKRFAKDNAERIQTNPLTVSGKYIATPRYFKKVLDIKPKIHNQHEVDVFLAHLPRVDERGLSELDVAMRELDVMDSVWKSRKQFEKDFTVKNGLKKVKDGTL